ncbi:terminase small subunit [Paenibacillus sp. FSL L8-0494]|uniref:terminase small subunit n=1 Tax=Paenibacillus sp. FSL L8-0494 TaxID=2975352 RepID=UPI0030F9EC26
MADLRPQIMIFVTEYLKNGNNATQAAISAGYSEKTAYSQGSRLLKSVEVQQYLNKTEQNLNRDLRQIFAEDAVEAYKVLKEIMLKPEAMDKDRIAAAKDILDRGGYKPVDKLVADVQGEVTHNHEYHIEQQITSDPDSAELLKQLWKRQASTLETTI